MYSASELPEFLAAISGTTEPQLALSRGIGRIAETFDAEVVAVVNAGQVTASVGYPESETGHAGLLSAAAQESSMIEIPGLGTADVATVYLDGPTRVLVIARAGGPLSNDEQAHAQAMARILTVAMRLVDKLDENERLLQEQRRLLEEHTIHEAIQEAILRVQRLISQRQPIQTILQAITTEAVFLLGADLAGICLYAPKGPSQRSLASGTDIGRALSNALPDSELLAIGEQATANSIGAPTSITIETLGGDTVNAGVAGCPIFNDGALIGGLFIVSAETPGRIWDIDTSPLETFASQASIALTDASTMNDLEHAFHDHLTGLPNRALFHDRFAHALEVSARNGSTTGLLFLDLDRFKSVNDTLGHAAGDALLRDVGGELQNAGRACDIVARIGGDEFAVVLEDTTPQAAEVVANRLLECVGRVVSRLNAPAQPGASIGIALSGPGCQSTDELLRRADIAMYAVKTTGGAGASLYDSTMGQTRLDQNAMIDALQTALVRDQFVVYYQPIINLQTRQISGVEALVRWRDPDRGLVPPAAFIDAAERTGMIVPIGRRVLETACNQAAEWRRNLTGAAELTISVNISVRQLEHSAIQDDIQQALDNSGLDPAALTLEVTESIFVDSADTADVQLRALKDLGVRLAIDDFGTGFSSLSYIHRYPFDILKIDRTFVRGLGTSANGGAVVRTMLALAQQLSMTTVAEGIECPGELAQLRALRCSHGQGFLFARPVDADALQRLLTDRSLTFSTTTS